MRVEEDPPFDAHPADANETPERRRPLRIHAVTIVVLVISLALIITAGILTNSVHRHTEQRLLDRQALQAGATLEAATGTISALLAPAAELATSSGGDADTFATSLAEAVGERSRYVSASLWREGEDEPMVVLGEAPALAADPDRLASTLATAIGSASITVAGIVGKEPAPRYGYAFGSQAQGTKYVVYVESPLPSPRRGYQSLEGAFSNLNYALYAGASEADEQLLYSSVEELPIAGRRATTTVPFGNASLLLVVTPIEPLSGGLSRTLPWIVAFVGVALSLGFAGLTERLLRRRDAAVATSRSLAVLSDETHGCTPSSAGSQRRSAQPAARSPPVPAADAGRRALLAGRHGERGRR